MVVVTSRAPFFVPSPSPDNIWDSRPVDSTILSYLTKQKMFGIGGQVPTMDWSSLYNYNVAESSWDSKPVDSPIIAFLTKQKMFGFGGQVPTNDWSGLYNYDVAESSWDSRPVKSPLSLIGVGTTTIFRAPFYSIRPDDSAFWLKPVANSRAILSPVAASPFKATLRSFSYVDFDYWSSGPLSPSPLLSAGVTATMFRAPFYVLRPDDSSVWLKTTANSKAILSITVVASPFKAIPQSFGYDDFAGWLGHSLPAPTPLDLTMYSVGVQNFVYTNNDPSSVWSASPISSVFISTATPPAQTIMFRGPFYSLRPDDGSIWLKAMVSSRATLFPGVVSNPSIAKQWHYDNDDSLPWKQPSQRSIALPFVPAIIDHWRMDIPDDQPWTLVLQRDLVASSVQPKPIISVAWRFNNDDPPSWQQPSQRSVALPFVPAIVNRWRIASADDQLWSSTAQYNIIFTSLTQLPFVNHRLLNPVDDQLWSFIPQHNFITATPIQSWFSGRWQIVDDQLWSPMLQRDLSLTATPFSVRSYSFAVDDTVWQWPRQKAITIIAPLAQNHLWPDALYDYPWSIVTHRNNAVNLNVPESFIIRQPSFANDDFPSYQWKVRNPIILSLKWNIRIERTAGTTFENRIVNAKTETRTAATSSEIRIAIAPDEDDLP